jgi:hypothetical protein
MAELPYMAHDQSLTDAHGNVWRVALNGELTRNGELWLPVGHDGHDGHGLGQIHHAVGDVQADIRALAASVGQWRTAIIGDVASLLLLAQNAATANHKALVTLLQQILHAATEPPVSVDGALLGRLLTGQQAISAQLSDASSKLTNIAIVQQTEIVPHVAKAMESLNGG